MVRWYASSRGRASGLDGNEGQRPPLGVNLRTLYRFIDAGDLPAYKFGRVIRLFVGRKSTGSSPAARIQPGEPRTPLPRNRSARRDAERTPSGDQAGDQRRLHLLRDGSVGPRPAKVVAETDVVVASRHRAVAPTHVLVVPRRRIGDASLLGPDEGHVLGSMLALTHAVAEHDGVFEGGSAAVLNVGHDANNSVGHLHLHVIGGRSMSWPPG